jgi:hypothetical protein
MSGEYTKPKKLPPRLASGGRARAERVEVGGGGGSGADLQISRGGIGLARATQLSSVDCARPA